MCKRVLMYLLIKQVKHENLKPAQTNINKQNYTNLCEYFEYVCVHVGSGKFALKTILTKVLEGGHTGWPSSGLLPFPFN